MRRRRLAPAHTEDGHEGESDFSLSIGDLMSALLLIFVLLLATTLFRMHDNFKRAQAAEQQAKNEAARVQNIARTYETLQDDLYADLQKTFAKDLERWKAEIDPETISFRFNSPDVLFQQGESNVKDNFKQILREFFPRYLAVLRQTKYIEHIEEIRIEGHTSQEWTQASSVEDAYFGNMQLSQDRTRSVLQYAMSLVQDASLREWCRQHITANGLSFSKVVRDSNGKENPERSRRVEFRVRTDSEKQIQKILLEQ